MTKKKKWENVNEWAKLHTKSYHLKLNKETDAEVIAKLDGSKNKIDLIRQAVKAYKP